MSERPAATLSFTARYEEHTKPPRRCPKYLKLTSAYLRSVHFMVSVKEGGGSLRSRASCERTRDADASLG